MGTAIVALALLSVVALIIRKMIKDKKQGKSFNVAVIANIVVDIAIRK